MRNLTNSMISDSTPPMWVKKRLKYCVALANEKTTEGKPYDYLGLENIESWTGKFLSAENPAGGEGQSNIFYDGNVLFGKLRPYLAKVFKANMEGACTGELLVLEPKLLLQGFLFYSLINKSFIDLVDSSTYGVKMPRASWEFIGNITLGFPDRAEQQAIADFLDRETARIDALIEKKKRQIDLLQEKRSALISHAVTKGLNPDVKLKDSGVEWLGQIPEHWDVLRAKVLFAELNDRSESGEEELLTVSHLTGVTARSEKNVNMFLAESLEGYKKCRKGDLVINTMWAWMGALGFAEIDGIVSPSYNVYRPRKQNTNQFYYDYLFRTGKFIAEMICQSKGVWSSRLRLYPEAFYEIRIPLPKTEEQNGIVEYILAKTGHVDVMKSKIEKSIDTLMEFRSSLISAAVTGQINVQEQPTSKSGLSKRLISAADYLCVQRDAESALIPICNAIDRVSKDIYGKSGRSVYKQFIHERMGLITRVAFNGLGILNMVFGVKQFNDGFGNPVKPHTTTQTGGPGFSFEQIIYHLVRCKLDHDCEVSDIIRDNGIGSGTIQMDNGTLSISFDAIAHGLLFAVLSEVKLQDELRGTVYESISWKDVPLIDLIGQKARFEELSQKPKAVEVSK